MFELDEKAMITQDEEDLIAILSIRFQHVPDEIVDKIKAIQKLEVLQRLMLVAANAADWQVFLDELKDGQASFKLLGERLNPISQNGKEG